jgi:hypothetical protein
MSLYPVGAPAIKATQLCTPNTIFLHPEDPLPGLRSADPSEFFTPTEFLVDPVDKCRCPENDESDLMEIYGNLDETTSLDIALMDTQSLVGYSRKNVLGAFKCEASADCMLSPPTYVSYHNKRVVEEGDISVLTESIFPATEEEDQPKPAYSSSITPPASRKVTRKRPCNEMDGKQPPDKEEDKATMKRIRNTEAARRSRERKALELQMLREQVTKLNEQCTYWRTQYELRDKAAEKRERELRERVRELEKLFFPSIGNNS